MNSGKRAERIIRLVDGKLASGSIRAVTEEIQAAEREAMEKCAEITMIIGDAESTDVFVRGRANGADASRRKIYAFIKKLEKE